MKFLLIRVKIQQFSFLQEAAREKMESTELPAQIKTEIDESQLDVKGNGNLKRKHGADANSDDENDFLGFDLGKLRSNFRPSAI